MLFGMHIKNKNLFLKAKNDVNIHRRLVNVYDKVARVVSTNKEMEELIVFLQRKKKLAWNRNHTVKIYI